MLKHREKNKHTLVYYLFRKKYLHNELTPEEQTLMQPPPTEETKKQDTLQSTTECLTSSKPDQLKTSERIALSKIKKKTLKQSDLDSEASSRLPSLSKAPTSRSPSKAAKSIRLDESIFPDPLEPKTTKAKANIVVDLKGPEFLT